MAFFGRASRVGGLLLLLWLASACGGGDDARGKDAGEDPDHRNGGDSSDDAKRDGAAGDDAARSGADGGDGDGDDGVDVTGSIDAGRDMHPPVCPRAGCMDGAIEAPCESTRIEVTLRSTARSHLLFVYDRSGSMANDWNGQPRWEAVGNAVVGALSATANSLSVGALFFPSSDPNATPVCIDPTGVACTLIPGLVTAPGTCGVNPIGASDQIAFTDGSDFLETFGAAESSVPLYGPIPGGQTPLLEALEAAQDALSDVDASRAAVIILTDGEPNCAWNLDSATRIMRSLEDARAVTHVVGMTDVAEARFVLEDLASAGSDPNLITPANAADLEEQLGSLLSELQVGTSCGLVLDEAIPVTAEVHVVVTIAGERYDVPSAGVAGWSLDTDRKALSLNGELCTFAERGELEALEIRLGCVDDLPLLDDF